MALQETLISYCGMVCSECEAYLATQDNDNDQRATVAEAWSKLYGVQLVPKDINCDGCVAKNCRHIGHWQTCEIRRCAQERAVQSCADCADYACQKLSAFLDIVSGNKDRLDALRAAR